MVNTDLEKKPQAEKQFGKERREVSVKSVYGLALELGNVFSGSKT